MPRSRSRSSSPSSSSRSRRRSSSRRRESRDRDYRRSDRHPQSSRSNYSKETDDKYMKPLISEHGYDRSEKRYGRDSDSESSKATSKSSKRKRKSKDFASSDSDSSSDSDEKSKKKRKRKKDKKSKHDSSDSDSSSSSSSDSESDSKKKKKKKKKKKYSSDSESSSSSDSDSDSDKDRKKKSKKKKRKYDSDSSSDSDSSDSSDYDDKKSRKKKKKKKDKKNKKKKDKKKDKKKKKKKHKGDLDRPLKGFGAYGILKETDIYGKEAEFRAWLVEVKNLDIEELSNQATKVYFLEYMEDYNTATLPHVKYYDIDKWDREQRLKRQRADLRALQDDEEMTIDFSRDEENIRKQHRAGMTIQQPTMTMSTEQVLELKRIQEERVAADKLRKMGYKPSSNLGIRYESQI